MQTAACTWLKEVSKTHTLFLSTLIVIYHPTFWPYLEKYPLFLNEGFFPPYILGLGQESKRIRRCWDALNLQHLVSHFQTSIWALCWCVGRRPQTGLKASDNFQYIPAMPDCLTLLPQTKDITVVTHERHTRKTCVTTYWNAQEIALPCDRFVMAQNGLQGYVDVHCIPL